MSFGEHEEAIHREASEGDSLGERERESENGVIPCQEKKLICKKEI